MMADWLLLPIGSAWAWPLSWALVTAALMWTRWPRAWLAVLVAVLAVWPLGGWSGYAALALQAPSLLSLMWAIRVLLKAVGVITPRPDSDRVPVLAWSLLCLLGWVLVMDTLNLWPRAWDVGWYAWGFSAASLWFSAVLVMALAWRQWGGWVWQAVGLLTVYAVMRWPTGNIWDAWLDPVVWVVAHVHVARYAWHAVTQRQRQ